jgi:hypothetical protein
MEATTTTARPFAIDARSATGHALWTGRRMRTFATVEAARAAAINLAAEILEHSPNAVAIHITEGSSQWHRRTVEVVEVEAR